MRKFLLAAALLLPVAAAAEDNPGPQAYRTAFPCSVVENPYPWADNAVPTPVWVTALGLTANGLVGPLPPNATIIYAIIGETAGHTVTIGFGSTGGGTNVLGSQSVPARTSVLIPAASFSKTWFSVSAPQAFYVYASSWSSASVNGSIYYMLGP